MLKNRLVIVVLLLYLAIVAGLTIKSFSTPRMTAIGGDAGGYHGGAVGLVTKGSYAFLGRPYTEREPGMSIFLAGIYEVFGTADRQAVFLVQGLLLLASALIFAKELMQWTSARIASLFLFILLMLPSVVQIIFSLYRECLALSLFLLFAASLFALLRRRSWIIAVSGGVALGALILTYMPYLLLPFFLIPLFWYLRVPLRYLAPYLLIAGIFVGAWSGRNYLITGKLCITGCYRSSITWYVRGEQAEQLRGLEPLRCLWSEYISRDWTGRSPACSFNSLMHSRWPQSLTETDADNAAGREGNRKIFTYFPHYLWFSVFEVLELHLPYVGPWGRLYNILTTIGTILLTLGCALSLTSLRRHWRKEYAVLLLMIGYTVAVFALTDATPRYLMPVIFCYATLAAVGYGRAV